MNLPKFETPIHYITLPISEKEIQIRPFVIKEEKALLTSINSDNKEEVIKTFDKIIEICVLNRDEVDIRNLNLIDFLYVLIYIRLKSLGEDVEGSGKCSSCGKQSEFTFNLEDSLYVDNKDKEKVMVKIDDSLTLELKSASANVFFEEDPSITDVIAASVSKVVFNKKVYKDFEREELKENILGNFTKKNFESISEKMDELPNMYVKFNYVCNHCQAMNEFYTEEVMDFF
mgnify:CR=1 FL=1